MSRAYSPRVQLLDTRGDHLRAIPGELARAMVDAGNAVEAAGNGRVRSIRLVTAASNAAARIGEPTPPSIASYGTKFIVREKLDNGGVTWKFHPRSFER
jgi:hypothetical protein